MSKFTYQEHAEQPLQHFYGINVWCKLTFSIPFHVYSVYINISNKFNTSVINVKSIYLLYFFNFNTICDTLLLNSSVITANLLYQLITNQFLLYFYSYFIIIVLYFYSDTLFYTLFIFFAHFSTI